MNKKFIEQNVGKQLRLIPPAQHVDEVGHTTIPTTDDWTLVAYEGDVLSLRNLRTGASGVLASDSVQSYRRDAEGGGDSGYLVLLAQPYIQAGVVIFRPVTRPGEALPIAPTNLLAEAYLQTSLECHYWKNAFLDLYGWDLPLHADAPTVDVWDALEANWPANYSDLEFQKYHRLFLADIVALRTRLDRVMQLLHHVLPQDYQGDIIRACRQLEVERSAYLQLPALLSQTSGADGDVMFRGRFVGVGRVLRQLSREADRRRDLLMNRQSG